MKNFVIWPVVLLAMAATAYSKAAEPAEPGKAPQESSAGGKTEGTPKELAVDLGGGVKMEMVLVPAGEFMMGSPNSDWQAGDTEKPLHRVRITKQFYLGVTEVTQGQYEQVMGKNPSRFKESGLDAPVEMVSWDDAQEFCQKLSELAEEKEAGRDYQLPTEAQWEYACRAGSAKKYCYGDDESRLVDYAWYRKNYGGKIHQVGQKKPNAWGLYDMHGNVWEWCADRYARDYYANSPTNDPTGPSEGSYRVFRGGGPLWGAGVCRSACRPDSRAAPGFRHFILGLRVSLVQSNK